MKRPASTADILGGAKQQIPVRWAKHHKHLCAIREHLEDSTVPKLEVERTDDVADAGSSEIEQNLDLAIHHATRETLGEVIAALRRIERGTYGICELTGEPIETDRLEATPWARYSLAGQTELEKSSVNRHARLGERQAVGVAEASEGGDGEEGEEAEASAAA